MKKQAAILLVAVALSVGNAWGGLLALGSRYSDESNGFAIYVPRRWEQVPTKFQDVALIGKWAGRSAQSYQSPGMLVYRFVAAASDEPASPGDGLEGGLVPPGARFGMRYQPKDIWAVVGNMLYKSDVLEDDAGFHVSQSGLKVHYRVYQEQVSPEYAARLSERELALQQTIIVAAQIETEEGGDAYGVIFGCSKHDAEDMQPTFKRIVQRFRVLDPEVEDDEAEGGITDADIFVDSSKKPEAWREARKRKLIEGWDALDTEHYLIVYNKEVKRGLLRTIAKHIEAIRAQVYEQLFPPAKEVTAVSVVRVCKDSAEYHRYGGPGASAGYWSPGDEELVFYQDKSNKRDSLRVLYHEAFHQYIHYAVGDVAPHSWFNEGHGDYFAGHNYRNGKFIPAPFQWRTGIIANALSQKTYVPLREFLKYTQGQYYSNAGLCYAEGWSFVYFLREVERTKNKKYKQYWGLLDKYFEAIKRNVSKVKEGGLYGLENPPAAGDDGTEGTPGQPGDSGEPAAEGPTLKRLPGLELPFPGEHPEAGRSADLAAGERRTVADGPKITGIGSALDAAVDEAFKGIDLDQLEKDWVEYSK